MFLISGRNFFQKHFGSINKCSNNEYDSIKKMYF